MTGPGLTKRQEACARHFWAQVDSLPNDAFKGMINGFMQGRTSADFVHLHTLLNEVDPGLLMTMADQPAREVIISAGGMKKLIPTVLAVVDLAPQSVLNRVEVRAFRPRMPDSDQWGIAFEGVQIEVPSVYFRAEPRRGGVDLDLYVPGYPGGKTTDPSCSPYANAVMILLDHLVGEYEVMTSVGGIDMFPASEKPAGARPLKELQACLDEFGATDLSPLVMHDYEPDAADKPFVLPVVGSDDIPLALVMQASHGRDPFPADDVDLTWSSLQGLALAMCTPEFMGNTAAGTNFEATYLSIPGVAPHYEAAAKGSGDEPAPNLQNPRSLVLATPLLAREALPQLLDKGVLVVRMIVGPVNPTTGALMTPDDPTAVHGVTLVGLVGGELTPSTVLSVTATTNGRVFKESSTDPALVAKTKEQFSGTQ
jgi:hypothetical protein